MTELRTCTVVAPPDPVACLRCAVMERPDNHAHGSTALNFTAPVAKHAAALTSRLWKPGRTLRVRMIGGKRKSRAIAGDALTVWMSYVSLRFVPVRDNGGAAEIRIAFDPTLGSWSMLGTDALLIPEPQPTMNLGWDDMGTALHEVGHMLGLIHEHQNPDANIPWDEEAVYRFYAGPPNNWPRAQTKANVLDVYNQRLITNGGYDPASIMLYPVPAALLRPEGRSRATGFNRVLSPGDKALGQRLYPPLGIKDHLDKLLAGPKG